MMLQLLFVFCPGTVGIERQFPKLTHAARVMYQFVIDSGEEKLYTSAAPQGVSRKRSLKKEQLAISHQPIAVGLCLI